MKRFFWVVKWRTGTGTGTWSGTGTGAGIGTGTGAGIGTGTGASIRASLTGTGPVQNSYVCVCL